MNLDENNKKDELLYLKKIINFFNINLDETLNKKIDNLNIKKSKKKSLKKSKKNIKKSLDTSIFYKSDLDNFLLLLKLLTMQNIRIVCHNNIMNNFIETQKSNNLINNVKIISKNQNLWSFFLNYDNKNIFITRHAYSISNLFKSKKQKIKQFLEKDPYLTLWGILTSLYRSHILHKEENIYIKDNNNNNNNRKKNNETKINETKINETKINEVYVSILMRTWMSAICLYLQYNSNKNFTLIISPFIKEQGSTPDNLPNKLNQQISQLISFLNNLKHIHTMLNKNFLEINNNSYLIEIVKNLNKIMIFFENKNEIVIKYPNKNFNIKLNNGNFELIENIEMNTNLQVYQGINFPNKKIIDELNVNFENILLKYS
jgi:hypothetical protein